jgi:hypothetical protein
VRRAALAALLLFVLGACRLEVHVGVTVEGDGSGAVTVAVSLDEDAVRRAGGNLEERIEVDDLVATGWTVEGPREEEDGLTWIRASKPFGTPEEAGRVMAEINGPDGPFRDFRVTRERSFARTDWTFEGTVDFRRGIEAFSDPELAAALDGQPLGESVQQIEERLDATIDRLVGIEVTVFLPGSMSSNAPLEADNAVQWQPGVTDTEPAQLRATGRERNVWALVWVAVAVVAGLALIVLVVSRRARPGQAPREP